MSSQLYVLGSRGSRPASGPEVLEFGGGTTCYIFKRGDHAVVIDCGSGFYNSAEILRGCAQVDILLTHLHYDHLIGLLEWSVFPPAAQVRFFAQFDRWFGEETLKRFLGPPFWPVSLPFGTLAAVPSPGEAELGGGLRARFHPSNHPDGASLIRLETPDGDVCAAFDYEHSPHFLDSFARGCEILLYDGMYTSEEYPDHVGWGHSYWEEGCRLADRLGIPRLVITHHHPARGDSALREMEAAASQWRAEIRFARAGDVFLLSSEGTRPVRPNPPEAVRGKGAGDGAAESDGSGR